MKKRSTDTRGTTAFRQAAMARVIIRAYDEWVAAGRPMREETTHAPVEFEQVTYEDLCRKHAGAEA